MKYKFTFISMLLILVLCIGAASAADIGDESDLTSEISISDSADTVIGTSEFEDTSVDMNTSDSSDVLGVSEDDVIGAGKFTKVVFEGAVNDTITLTSNVGPYWNPTDVDYERQGYAYTLLPFEILDENGDHIDLKADDWGSTNNWGIEYDGIANVGEEYYSNLEWLTSTYNNDNEHIFLGQFVNVAIPEGSFADYAKIGNHTITIFNKARTFEYTLNLVLIKPKSVEATVNVADVITVNITTDDGPGNFTVYVGNNATANGTVGSDGKASVSFDKVFGKNTIKVLLDGNTTAGLKYETSINIPKDSVGGFLDLNRTIANATDVLNLTRDYNLELGQSDLFSSGLLINKNLTINGNGHVINATCSDGTTARFEIAKNVILTLNNVTIYGGRHSNGAVINVGQYSNIILNNVTFTKTRGRYGGAIALGNYANLTATDVTFKNNTATSGAAIFANQHTFINLTNVLCDSNKATGDGGNIYVGQYGTVFVDNSTFKNYYVRGGTSSGAIYLHSYGVMNISDSLFENITVAISGAGRWWGPTNNNGGVIKCEDRTTLNVTGSTFRNNKNINDNGNGGAYSDAYANGGVIFSTGSNSYSYISDSVFENNKAHRAGAIYTRNADIIGCLFVNNSGTNDFPEIYYEGNGKGTISHNAFLDNYTVIRLMNSASNIVETTNWWGTNTPGDLVRIQNDYYAPNNNVVMTVYNEGNTAYAALTRDSNGNFIENPELIPVRPAVFEASNTTTVNTNNGIASTEIADSQVNITIDGETLTLFMAPGNITSIQILSVENATVGSNGTIYFMLNGDNGAVDGKLTVIVNDKPFVVDITNGLAIAKLGEDFDAGVYNISYIYEGGVNYAAIPSKTKAEEKLGIYKSDVTITINREKNIITFVVAGDNDVIPTGTINATVGNISKIFTLSNGAASYNYGAELAPGTYDVNVTYSGDKNNNNGSLITTFDIIKYEVTITFTNVTNTLTFNVAGVNDVVPTGTIIATLGDSTQTLTLRNGAASYDFGKDLVAGEYNLTVNYSGDDYYNPNVMEDTFEVVKMMPTIDLTIQDINMTLGSYNYFTITINGDENVPTGTVVIIFGNNTYSYSRSLYRSNSVTFSYGNRMDAGVYNVTVTYSGDGYYYATNMTYNGTLNILPKITISAPTKVYSEQAPLKVSINPIDVNGTLIVKMDGVELFAGDIESGSFYMVLSNLEAGEHTFEAFYGGNDKYLPVTATVTTTVSFPELPQWGQAGYDYTNGGQSPYIRLDEVIELWNYSLEEVTGQYSNAILIDAEGNIYIPHRGAVVSLRNDGTERWTSGSGWKSFAIDANGNMVTPQAGNAFNFMSLSDGRSVYGWGSFYEGSSSYSTVIGPDGIVYVNYEYSYPNSGWGGDYGDRRWIGLVEWDGNNNYNYRGEGNSLLLIEGPSVPAGTQPHLAPVTLDNLGNLWHTSTTGLRGVVIGTNVIGFQDANIGTKGRAVVDANNVVYAFGADDKIYALTMSGVLWNTTVTDGSGSTMVVGKDSEYILSVNSEGVLYKYDVTDGKETKIYDFETTVSAALMTDANGVIYVGDDDGTFWALSDNGTVLWKFDAGSAIVGRPAMDKDGVIYIYTADKMVFALGNHKDNSTISLEVNDTTTVEGLTAIATVSENATGDVVFTLSNGDSYKVEIINGTATLIVDDILSGDYNITASYGGNYAFRGNETNATFTVTKSNATIDINVTEIYVDVNGTIIITVANATGDIEVTIDGLDQYNLTLVDSVANITLPILEEGKYNITVNYLGDETFFNATEASEFEVIKYTPEVSIDVEDVSVLENATLTVNVTNATGNVTVKVGEKEQTVELENGTATIVLDLLPAGTQNITVTYEGDDLFNEASNEISLNVSKVDTELEADVEAGEAFEDVTITVTVNDVATGNITVTIDGNDYTGEISECVAEITVPDLTAGDYTAVISYAGDDKVNENSANVTFTVDKIADYEIETAENLSSIASGNITVTLPEKANGKVTIVIDNKTYTADAVNGTAVVDIPAILPGEYDYVVLYTDDDNYDDSAAVGSVEIAKEDFELVATFENDTVTVEVPELATGYVLVSVDGKGYFAPIEDGVANVQIFGLDGGNYTAEVTYTGDAVFNPANTTCDIEIPLPEEANVTVDINASEVGVELPEDAEGYVVVSVDGKNYYFDADDEIELDLSDLAPGNYTVEVAYSGDDKYAPAKANYTVEVPEVVPEDANLTADAQNTTITVKLAENATGNVLVDVNGTGYFAPIENGQATIEVIGLDEGTYDAVVTYEGDDTYAPANATVAVTVPAAPKNETDVDPEANVTASEDAITMELPEDATGYMLVDVDGTGYYVPVENGTATFELPELAPGNHTVGVTYTGDKKYAPANSTETIEVPLPEETIFADDLVKVDKAADRFVANFTDSEGNPLANANITFNINGQDYTRVTDANGQASIAINLSPGNYTITTTNPVTGDSKVNNITVLSRFTEDGDLVKHYRNDSQYVLRVLGDDTNPVGAGEIVTYNINGVFYNRTTNASGHVKLNINLAPGTYIITAEYKGAKVAHNVTVLPILTAEDLTKKFGEAGAFEAHVYDAQGKPAADQRVEFNINGVLYYRTSGSDGIAKLNINLGPGEYIITSAYGGATIGNTVTVTA